MDWKDMLEKLREDPSLPQGEKIVESENEEKEVRKKKDTLRIFVEKKGRNGKIATIIEGFTAGDAEVASVAAMLKKKIGVGGSARGGEILIQGNHAEKVRELLIGEGYRVK